jgi:hypothetical protein
VYLLLAGLFHPIGNKNIGLVRRFTVAMGGPNHSLAIRAEHRETVEVRMIRNALLTRAVFVDYVKIEIASIFRIGLIGSKNNTLVGPKFAAPLRVT